MLILLYVVFLAFVKEFFDVRYSVKQIYFVELKKFCCIVGPRKVLSERILTVSLAEIFLVNLRGKPIRLCCIMSMSWEIVCFPSIHKHAWAFLQTKSAI